MVNCSTPFWARTGQSGGKLDAGKPAACDGTNLNLAEARGPGWETIEEPLDIAGAIKTRSAPGTAVLVDCLTLWLSNLMFRDADLPAETDRLAAALQAAGGPVVLVTNEVGSGIVPDNALARRFRDEQGRLNRKIAASVEAVVLVACGLPLVLKPNSLQPEITL